MSERAAYSRLYWTIVDDPKFQHVYDDDRAFAAWVRLLMIADQAWPATAHLPAGIRRQAVEILAGAGLVDLQPGGRYRIHGLDAERTRRRDAATRKNRGDDGGDNPTAPQPVPNRDPDGPYTSGLRRGGDEEENETRKDEGDASATDTDDLDGPLAYYQVTQRYPQHHSELHAWVTTLAEGYGAETFQKALASEYIVNHRLNDLISRTEARLAKDADRNRKRNPVTFDRAAWVERKRQEQEARYNAEEGAA